MKDTWPRELERAYRIPARTVLLGHVLDVSVELAGGEERLLIQEWEGWALLCDADAMGRAPGRARLFLVPDPNGEADNVDLGDDDDGEDTYERWHDREADGVRELDFPDEGCSYQLGRCIRIGYRSDKWGGRGEAHDYDHDFRERGHTAPLLYIDTRELERARAAVIVGGDMRVTARGID